MKLANVGRGLKHDFYPDLKDFIQHFYIVSQIVAYLSHFSRMVYIKSVDEFISFRPVGTVNFLALSLQ